MSVAIQTTGLGKRYGSVWALRDCSVSGDGLSRPDSGCYGE